MNRFLMEDWLNEEEVAQTMGQPDGPSLTSPEVDPNSPQDMMPDGPNPNDDMSNNDLDVTQDPDMPDMPEEGEEYKDFETWKNNYFKESIKNDFNALTDMLNQVRDRKLNAYQKKFVDDNLNIQLLKHNSNIDRASREIRKSIKQELDKSNPTTSVLNHITTVLDSDFVLNNIFIKINGYGGLKSDLHRKYIAALVGAAQVGSGANTEDIIINDNEYSIMISTRYNAKWGDVYIGNWSLKEDDPQRYLSEPEQKRLQEGSPEEKDVLRKRIVMESIAKQFETRGFLITVPGEDGTMYHLAWDIADSLRAAYMQGTLVVKTRQSDNSEAFITDDGQIIPFMDLSVHFTKETGKQTPDGKPEKEELDFLERKNGALFLTANLNTIKLAANALQGAVFKETPYNGNPSDLKVQERCIYSAHDLLMKQC